MLKVRPDTKSGGGGGGGGGAVHPRIQEFVMGGGGGGGGTAPPFSRLVLYASACSLLPFDVLRQIFKK